MIEHSLDQVYRALADSTRRGMLVTLRDGPARITDMAAPLPMSFAAAARHVGVLEAAGLIEREVRAFVKDRLGSVKAPKQVEVWPDLPRSKVGKVLKVEVKARFL